MTPDDPNPPTDEFGRDDPDAIEREKRRREREARRGGKRGAPAPRAPAPPEGGTAEQPLESRARARKAKRRKQPPPASAADAAASPPKRSKQPRQPKPPKPPRPPRGDDFRRRRAIAFGGVLVGVLAVWFLIAFFQPFAGDGEGEGSVTVEIPDGASAGEIAGVLDDAGVVSSGRLFEWRLKLAGKSGDVQADTYTLAEGMSYGAAIDRLTGEQKGGTITVTIPEGLSREQIASDVLPEGVSSDEYLALTETAPKGFNPAQYGAKSRNLEGFLFPATYELGPNDGVQSLVDQQLAAIEQNLAKVDMAQAKKKNLTPYDVLIIASMVDKEVQVPKERELVAAVIYNRLKRGIPLGIDATTRYETGNYTDQITQADLDKDTPYNTRLNPGLTPTPIGNPGLDSIKAAANPAKVPFLYFVVKPGTCGEHSFTASEAEFEQLAAQYQQALEEQGGSPTECPE